MPTTPTYPVVFNGTSGNPTLLTVDGVAYRGGYCSLEDVTDFFINNDLFTKVTSNQRLLAKYIADASQDVDRVLETMYITPLAPNTPLFATATNALTLAQVIIKHMAAAKVHEQITHVDGYTDAHAAHVVALHEYGSQRLDDIARGVTQLFDAAPQPGGEKPVWPVGAAAQFNPDYVTTPYIDNPDRTAPIYGVRDDPPYNDHRWIP